MNTQREFREAGRRICREQSGLDVPDCLRRWPEQRELRSCRVPKFPLPWLQLDESRYGSRAV